MADIITQVQLDKLYDIRDSRVDGLVTGVSSVNGQTGNVTISIPTIPTNHVTTDTTQTITANKTHTGVNTFSNGNFSIRANSGNDDSWIQLTNSGNSAYYAFGIRRPYTSYGLQLKYHPDASNPDSSRPGTGTSDIYYDIYHQGNYTKIPAATTSTAGLMSTGDKAKLDGIAAGANAYTHPSYTARTGVPTANQTPAFGGTFSVSQPVSDATGHITAINSRTITIPSTAATTSAAGLMSAADKATLTKMSAFINPDSTGGEDGTIGSGDNYIRVSSAIAINAMGLLTLHSDNGNISLEAGAGNVYANNSKVLTEANINYDSTNKILTIS